MPWGVAPLLANPVSPRWARVVATSRCGEHGGQCRADLPGRERRDAARARSASRRHRCPWVASSTPASAPPCPPCPPRALEPQRAEGCTPRPPPDRRGPRPARDGVAFVVSERGAPLPGVLWLGGARCGRPGEDPRHSRRDPDHAASEGPATSGLAPRAPRLELTKPARRALQRDRRRGPPRAARRRPRAPARRQVDATCCLA